MIFITQGHQKSIAIEVMVKSFYEIDAKFFNLFKVFINRDDLQETLTTISNIATITNDGINIATGTIPCSFFESNSNIPNSTQALSKAIESITSNSDILLTLPTSKDQLLFNSCKTAGYTEYLRHYFNDQNIAMLFKAKTDNFLLITDHLPLKSVSTVINKNLIVKKTSNTLDCYQKYFSTIGEVYFAGINPHAGENGILGNEDNTITTAISSLKEMYPQTSFHGPFSGDTLHMYRSSQHKQLFVYMFHDQGLPIFKERNGLIGLNISTGLPFLRMSVDHGTAFNLYGKNCADPSGCIYMLRKAIQIQLSL